VRIYLYAVLLPPSPWEKITKGHCEIDWVFGFRSGALGYAGIWEPITRQFPRCVDYVGCVPSTALQTGKRPAIAAIGIHLSNVAEHNVLRTAEHSPKNVANPCKDSLIGLDKTGQFLPSYHCISTIHRMNQGIPFLNAALTSAG
jgi:hypothetical protein